MGGGGEGEREETNINQERKNDKNTSVIGFQK